MSNIIRLQPLHFVHVLNLTTNITKVEVGPKSLVLQTNERLAGGPYPFVIVPPGHYCIIKNPCKKYEEGRLCELRHGDFDVRFQQEPFPIYPGEVVVGAEQFADRSADYRPGIKPLPVIQPNHGLRLMARIDHDDGGIKRTAGECWQVEGPATYRPTPEVDIMGITKPVIIKSGDALRLRATEDFTDRDGSKRVTGEEWLITKEGAYLVGVHEEVVKMEQSQTLTPNSGVHLRAQQGVIDSMGIKRKAGEEWLVTGEKVETHYPQIGIEIISNIQKIVLRKGQNCVVIDPVDSSGHLQLGKREVRKGVCSFFLHPGESLARGIEEAHILADNEALVLQATDSFEDPMAEGKKREPGEKWMIQGPTEYIPPVEVEIKCKRRAIPLSKNEGVYVRDAQLGEVRAEMGPQAYLLQANEELWEKKLDNTVENLLKLGGGDGADDIRKIAYFEQCIDPAIARGRDKTRVVTYRCPHNTACQVYNYKKKTARVLFGPDLVILGPQESFYRLSLSAGKPKKPNALQSLCLMLGPDFITDIIEVETSDHARLSVKLAFNNHFEYNINDGKSVEKLFSVADFIGFACKQIGSRIRGSVAQIPFDEFHKHSAKIIQHAVFGVDKDGKPLEKLKFEANNLVISGVDVQSIEPVDLRMRDSLSKSVQMAIEIATSSIEASASHEAARVEQIARGELERQKLANEKDSEKEKTILYELQAISAAVESTGQAVAEAEAQRERVIIECESAIEIAKLKAEAENIEHGAQLSSQTQLRALDLAYQKETDQIDIDREKDMADVETGRLASMVSTIGAKTIAAIANSGPEMKVKLLKGLGLESTLITDGNTPINLFNTAEGLVSQRGSEQ